MTLYSDPFPLVLFDDPQFGLEAHKSMIEKLLRYCGEEFITKNVPEMETRTWSSSEKEYIFPSGFSAEKCRKVLKRVWKLIPEGPKKCFLAKQLQDGLAYLGGCFNAYAKMDLWDERPLQGEELRLLFELLTKAYNAATMEISNDTQRRGRTKKKTSPKKVVRRSTTREKGNEHRSLPLDGRSGVGHT